MASKIIGYRESFVESFHVKYLISAVDGKS